MEQSFIISAFLLKKHINCIGIYLKKIMPSFAYLVLCLDLLQKYKKKQNFSKKIVQYSQTKCSTCNTRQTENSVLKKTRSKFPATHCEEAQKIQDDVVAENIVHCIPILSSRPTPEVLASSGAAEKQGYGRGRVCRMTFSNVLE